METTAAKYKIYTNLWYTFSQFIMFINIASFGKTPNKSQTILYANIKKCCIHYGFAGPCVRVNKILILFP